MKKTLATQLRERTETIEYRAIKKELLKVAQNRGNEFRRLYIEPDTVTRLQNEGLTVEKITEHGFEKFKISW